MIWWNNKKKSRVQFCPQKMSTFFRLLWIYSVTKCVFRFSFSDHIWIKSFKLHLFIQSSSIYWNDVHIRYWFPFSGARSLVSICWFIYLFLSVHRLRLSFFTLWKIKTILTPEMARDNSTSKSTHDALNAHGCFIAKLVYWNGRVRLPKCITKTHKTIGWRNRSKASSEHASKNKNTKKKTYDTNKTMIQVALFGWATYKLHTENDFSNNAMHSYRIPNGK